MSFDYENVLFKPALGEVCIAVPHGTDWGFDSLDPAGVEIKGYDGDYVWMLANRTEHITTHIDFVTFYPVKPKPERQPLSINDLLEGGWYTQCCDLSDAYVLLAMGVEFFEHPDLWGEVNWEALHMSCGWSRAGRSALRLIDHRRNNEIYRDGVHFYWSDT